ncbi:MAG TPA: hypothetical protein V6D22_09105, partial [Candidatus Obscuribacterales bacterium]
MSPNGEPLTKRALVVFRSNKERRDIERKLLAAAFKLSFEKGDTDGAALAHKGLCSILQSQLYDDGDGSSGAVIPSSVWKSQRKEAPSEFAVIEEAPVVAQAPEVTQEAVVAEEPAVAQVPEAAADADSVSVTPAPDCVEAPSVCIAPPVESTENGQQIDASPSSGTAAEA